MNKRRIRRIWSKSIRNRDRKINRSTEADRKNSRKNRKNRKTRLKEIELEEIVEVIAEEELAKKILWTKCLA